MLLNEERVDWPDDAKLALSVVVNVDEGSEMTIARGDRGMEPVDELGVFVKSKMRNHSNESDYLYGIKAGAPRIVTPPVSPCASSPTSSIPTT